MSEEYQVCEECNVAKLLEEFPIDRRSKTGYKKICKTCFNEKYKERNNRKIEPEKVIKDYLKDQVPDIFKALSIQSIAEEKDFMDVLMDSIQPKVEFMNIINQYKAKD